jgi:hypothetical protein
LKELETTMTNIKSKGFRTKAELDAHLSELEDEAPADEPEAIKGVEDDRSSAREQVAALRAEVADLSEQLTSLRRQTDDVSPALEGGRPWLRIAVTVVSTFVLGKLVQRLGLGTSWAAVPIFAKQTERRIR